VCGIVSVLQSDADRTPPALSDVLAVLDAAGARLPFDGSAHDLVERLVRCAEAVEATDALLRGAPGIVCLAGDPSATALLGAQLDSLWSATEALEADLDAPDTSADEFLEPINAAVIRLKDAIWAVRRDRLRTADATIDLAGRDASLAALKAFAQIQIALAAIDRLEVRGRDSAGLVVVVRDHGLTTDAPAVRDLWQQRCGDPLYRSMCVREQEGNFCFVYKAAAEIGELGDNTRRIREAIRTDPLLHLALSSDRARALVLGHTRWASVGMISEANAHPLSSEELERTGPQIGPLCLAVLNGDIDNHADLRVAENVTVPVEITTDAKIIPVLHSRRSAEGLPHSESFRRTVGSFDGSVAIAAVDAAHPGNLLLALRGSGQALYVGLAEDAFVVASEPYGLVEQCSEYLRMDGELPADPGDPTSRGQIVVLDDAHAGTLDGLRRFAYNGAELPVDASELHRAQITTRDVDRGSYPHFLLKEIEESPRSFRKTLRGRLVQDGQGLRVVLGTDALPEALRHKLRAGGIRRIVVTGQGTAAVAGQAVAAALRTALDTARIAVETMAAPELSGFGLRPDMSDTLLVAISQSGTTTDTNRTVEVARARGATIVAIVNRRQSDLVDRSDGVIFTSDGRDVEMAVPSTKAFYAQVAAGFLLAAAVAAEVPGAPGIAEGVLRALRDLPDAMERVIAQRDDIAEIARRHAPYRRDWAVVGNGANRVAAEEVRIKLSELCYKSVSCDVTEEKKHIDLSAEPLIFVCASGLYGSNAEDVGKEIAYFRAHKAAPIVVAGEGEGRYESALEVIWVPSLHPDVAFVLSAMAGHLFGYEAALAIDAQARPLREARVAIEAATEVPSADGRDPTMVLERLRAPLGPIVVRFLEGLRAGAYDGHLEPSTAVRVASLFRYATGLVPLDAYQLEHGKTGTPFEVLEDLMEALTAGIDELTRPVDAIRHQAKTVTVGITRADETLMQLSLVRELLGAGVPRDRISFGTLRALAALDAAVEQVTGYTHYTVEGDVDGEALLRITDRGGIAHDIPSRTERDPRLRGTKHRVAVERELLIARGHDGRTLIFVPEVKGPDVTGIALLHARFHDRLPADTMRVVLQGYRDRYSALRDLVTETEPTFRDDLLGEISVVDLLINSIQALAELWRTG
jgi:glucosamine--fructose-6-phosphate aminotransferase (isomerizing)